MVQSQALSGTSVRFNVVKAAKMSGHPSSIFCEIVYWKLGINVIELLVVSCNDAYLKTSLEDRTM